MNLSPNCLPAGGCLSQVFDSVCELVQSALDGYHVCLFSYGQTGAGKTFTMAGGPTPEQQGIMPRAVQQVTNLRLPSPRLLGDKYDASYWANCCCAYFIFSVTRLGVTT
jgi:hypothetical protein